MPCGSVKQRQRLDSNSVIISLMNLSEKGFPYILLTPAVVFTLFLTVVPLTFGVMIAFTNYSSPNHLPPRSLVDWVGFKNFIKLFKLPSIGKTFAGVAYGPFMAILSTLSTFLVDLCLRFIKCKQVALKNSGVYFHPAMGCYWVYIHTGEEYVQWAVLGR